MRPEEARAIERVWKAFPDVMQSRTGAVFFVESRSTAGAWWRLEQAESEETGDRIVGCSCPAGQSNPDRMCRHRRRLMDYLSAMAAARRPAPAPFNAGAFVD